MKKYFILSLLFTLLWTCQNKNKKEDLDNILTEFNAEVEKTKELLFEFKNQYGNSYDFKLNDTAYLNKVLRKIQSPDNYVFVNYYKLIYLSFAVYKPLDYQMDQAKNFFNEVIPQDSAWAKIPQAYFAFNLLFPKDDFENIQNKFLINSSSRFIKLSILTDKLPTLRSTDPDEFNKVFSIIKNEYGDLEFGKTVVRMFEENSSLKIGSEIPDFIFVSIDDSSKVFTKESLKGRKYLIDFWATWCKPCLEELPYLENANNMYNKSELQILSVSIDNKKEFVQKYREEVNSMNWDNIFINKENKSQIMSDFEIIGIPKPFLVNEEGKIIAMEFELRGDKLFETLDKHIK